MRYMVTGGAGFIGSHLCEELLREGHEVICVDNYVTGNKKNIEHLKVNDRFYEVEDNAGTFAYIAMMDGIFHLASPTSPGAVNNNADMTLISNGIATYELLKLADRYNAKFLFVSSVKVHGQCTRMESYIAGKKYGEMLCIERGAKVARLANTYGPRMAKADSRVVPVFIDSALAGLSLSCWNGGKQTDSFCYVTDIVRGLIDFMESDHKGVIEFGYNYGISIRSLAEMIINLSNSRSKIITHEDVLVAEECHKVADLTKAKEILGWKPIMSLDTGLSITIEERRERMNVQHRTSNVE